MLGHVDHFDVGIVDGFNVGFVLNFEVDFVDGFNVAFVLGFDGISDGIIDSANLDFDDFWHFTNSTSVIHKCFHKEHFALLPSGKMSIFIPFC